MPDGDASAPPISLCLATDFIEVHPGWVEVEVEMEVDVEIEAPRNGIDAGDLLLRLRIGIGTAADEVGAGVAGLHQQLLGARIIEQALLREHADFEVDRPAIILLKPADRLEAAQPDAWVHFDMGPHV